jgi:hypothetical protein
MTQTQLNVRMSVSVIISCSENGRKGKKKQNKKSKTKKEQVEPDQNFSCVELHVSE